MKKKGERESMSGAQRALWTFLMYTLVGPFFAAIVIAAVLVLAPLLGPCALLPQLFVIRPY